MEVSCKAKVYLAPALPGQCQDPLGSCLHTIGGTEAQTMQWGLVVNSKTKTRTTTTGLQLRDARVFAQIRVLMICKTSKDCTPWLQEERKPRKTAGTQSLPSWRQLWQRGHCFDLCLSLGGQFCQAACLDRCRSALHLHPQRGRSLTAALSKLWVLGPQIRLG